MRVRQDTIAYRTAAYADGSERSVEELLRKLPGVNVAENGDITVKGKPVQKVMIEGAEFFGKNYKLISRNLNANLVETVEAIDNYSENPLLHGIEKSGKMVLNLAIKADRKRFVFGTLSAEGGPASGRPSLRYEGRLALFSLLGRLKAGFIGNANNTGSDPIAETRFQLEEDAKGGLAPEHPPVRPLVNLQATDAPDLEARRYTFNRARLAGGNVNYKISDRLAIKSFGYFYNDLLRFSNTIRYEYLLPGVAVVVQDSAHLRRRPTLGAGQIRVDYQPSETTRVQFLTAVSTGQTESAFSLQSRNVSLSENLRSESREHLTQWAGRLTLTQRLKGRNALLLTAHAIRHDLPQSLTVQSVRYSRLVGVPSAFTQLVQPLAYGLTDRKATLFWKGATNRSHYSFGVGFLHNASQVRTDTRLQSEKTTISLPDSLAGNAARYSQRIFFAEELYLRSFRRLKLYASAAAHRAALQWNASERPGSFRQDEVFVNHSLGFRWDLSDEQKLYGAYIALNALPAAEDLVGAYYLADYRTFRRGTPRPNLLRDELWRLNYSNINWTSLLTLTGSLTYSQTNNPCIRNAAISNELSFISLQPFRGTNHTAGAAFQADRFFPALSANVRIGLTLSQTDLRNQVAGGPVELNQLRSAEAEVRFTTAYDGWFNVEVGGSGSRFVLANTAAETPNAATTLLRPRLVVRVKPTSLWRLRAVPEAVDWRNGPARTTSFFFNAVASYTPEKSRFSLTLTGQNLLQTRQFTYTQLSNFLIAQKTYLLQPRYVTLQVACRL